MNATVARNRDQIAASIESLRMRGLATLTTIGADLRNMSHEALLELESAAHADKAATLAARAADAAREQAHYDATHQNHEQMQARAAERVVNLHAREHDRARENDARRGLDRAVTQAPEPAPAA